VVVLTILLPEWMKGNELKTGNVLSILSIIYIVFFQVNLLLYFGIVTSMSFLAIVERLASVFGMEEHNITRHEKPMGENEDAIVEIKDGSYSWGFRVKENQVDDKKARQSVLVEEAKDAIIKDINIDLKKNDHMIVVGQVGTGKTTLLFSIMEETK